MIPVRFRAAAFALAVAVASVTSPASAQENCVSRREGANMVKSRQIMPFPVAAQRAGISSRDVQGVALCGIGGRFLYRVIVVQKSGRPRSISIPAN